MNKAKGAVELIIDMIILDVSKKSDAYFFKNEVLMLAMNNKAIAQAREMLRKIKPDFEAFFVKSMNTYIGKALQARDSQGLRVYECYAAGDPERRWMRFTSMNAEHIRSVLSATKRQGEEIMTKAEVLEVFLVALEAVGSNATVIEVYGAVVETLKKTKVSA